MAAAGNDHLRTGDVSERPPIEDDPAVQVRSPSDARAVAVATVALLLVSLVALASGGSPWHAGGRQDVPAGIVSALAAVAGALLVGSLLLAWVGTPSVEKRRRRRRVEAKDLEGLGASLSTAGRTAAVVIGAIGLFLLLVLPFLVPNTETPPGAPAGNARAPERRSVSAPTGDPTSISAQTWLVVCAAAAVLLVAFMIRRRRAQRGSVPQSRRP